VNIAFNPPVTAKYQCQTRATPNGVGALEAT
jgi:hypothetical protein